VGSYEKIEDSNGGFQGFMLVIGNNLLRDNKYSMVFRVGIGVFLSIVDCLTDIYVIKTNYRSNELVGQANALLVMIVLNLFCQLLVVYAQYRRKSWSSIFKEILITISFIRPAVDAYRVRTNFRDPETSFDSLSEVSAGHERICTVLFNLFLTPQNLLFLFPSRLTYH